MNQAWQDINLPGFTSGKNKEEKQKKFITGVDGDDSSSTIPPEDEVRIISAEWVEGPKGFVYNEQCFVDVKVEYLKKTIRAKLTGTLFGIYANQEIDIAQVVNGFIDDETLVARMDIKKMWFINHDHYIEWLKNPQIECQYLLKNIKHSRGANTIDSPALKLPSSPGKIAANFIEIADMHFDLNCALPCLDSKGELATALANALLYSMNNPEHVLIVEGHSDTSGDPSYNLTISKLRGQAVMALLSNNIALWNDVISKNGSCHTLEVRDYQTTLKALSENYGWSCDPGKIDNCDGPTTQEGVKKFQAECNKKFNKNFSVDGVVGPKTWEAIMIAIRNILEDQFKNVSGQDVLPKLNFGYSQGNGIYPCGESCPIENAGNSNYKSSKNRRVELVFYPAGDPTPVVSPAAGRTIGLEKDPVTEKEWDKSPVTISNVVPVVDSIEITSVPSQFAPSSETCKIKYKVEGKNVTGAEKGLIIIKDKTGKQLLKKDDLVLDPAKESFFEWDGKDSGGSPVNLTNAPVEIQISVKGSPKIVSSVKTVKIEIHSVDITIPPLDATNRIIMNNPETAIEAEVLVKLKKADGLSVIADIPLDVKFTFTDPAPVNTVLASSYTYDPAPKNLGKSGNPNAVFWKKHADCSANSSDGYKTSCVVSTITTKGAADLGKAKVFFLPSGVGGDTYTLKATILPPGGTNVLLEKESVQFTIWRSVDFNRLYEMNGTTHVSLNSTTAIIAPTFDPAQVKYTAGGTNAISAANSVEYIGLWKNAATPQESWATMITKKPTETPSATEIADANYAGADPAALLKRETARQAICAKAQLWVNRIDTARDHAMDQWLVDAGIPANSIVGIKKYHPKYSTTADTNTSEWDLYGAGTPAWLRVTAFSGNYTNVDPDKIWVNGGHWGGLSVGNGIFSVPDYVAHVITKVVAHEAGHASKSFFKRDDFGPSLDHSASNAGIMYFDTSGGNNFTDREKKILRGVVP